MNQTMNTMGQTSREVSKEASKDASACPPAFSVARRLGVALVISGPSGAGKSSICAKVRQLCPSWRFSVSCTTRPPRPGEEDGRDYFFISRARFDELVAAGAFLEHAEVYGNRYGTLRSEVLGRVQAGEDVLLDVDVQGGAMVRRAAKDDPVLSRCLESVFISPPSLAVLEERLRRRGTESGEQLARRLAAAGAEIAHVWDYGYVVVNDQLDEAVADMLALLRSLRLRTSRLFPPDTAAGNHNDKGGGRKDGGRP